MKTEEGFRGAFRMFQLQRHFMYRSLLPQCLCPFHSPPLHTFSLSLCLSYAPLQLLASVPTPPSLSFAAHIIFFARSTA